jgi:5-methylcytosine-specific restriction endonuclease McrA
MSPLNKQEQSLRNHEYYISHQAELVEKKRIYHATHKEEEAKAKRAWRKNHPEEARRKDRQYDTANHEKRIERGREYYAKHRQEKSAKSKQWHLEHPGYSKTWWKEHPDRTKEYHKNDVPLSPEKQSEYNSRRRARKLAAKGKHTASEWKSIKLMYGNKCLACGKSNVKLTRDHVIPLIKGGEDCIGNIQPLCQSCNSKKHTTEIDYRPAYFWVDWT